MNVDQLLSGESGATDIGNQVPDITSSITDMLGPVIWLSTALTIAFIVLYIIAMVRRRKLENAIFDMQKTLREMNERDKARMAPMTSSPKLRTDSETIASLEQPEGSHRTSSLG